MVQQWKDRGGPGRQACEDPIVGTERNYRLKGERREPEIYNRLLLELSATRKKHFFNKNIAEEAEGHGGNQKKEQ